MYSKNCHFSESHETQLSSRETRVTSRETRFSSHEKRDETGNFLLSGKYSHPLPSGKIPRGGGGCTLAQGKNFSFISLAHWTSTFQILVVRTKNPLVQEMMIMSPFCSLVIQNGGGVLTSSSGTRTHGRHGSEEWRQRSIDRRSEKARINFLMDLSEGICGLFFLEDSMVLKYCKWKKN